MKFLEKEIKHYADMLTEHELRELTPPDCEARTFYMTKPATRAYSVLLTFSPEGITISGDLMICGNTPVGCRPKGLRWFIGELSPDYLAGKFLPSKWVPDRASEDLEDLAVAREREDDPEGAKLIRAAKPDGSTTCGCSTWDALSDLDIDMDDWPHHCIDPWEMACLAAVQQRFAQLYAAHVKKEEVTA